MVYYTNQTHIINYVQYSSGRRDSNSHNLILAPNQAGHQLPATPWKICGEGKARTSTNYPELQSRALPIGATSPMYGSLPICHNDFMMNILVEKSLLKLPRRCSRIRTYVLLPILKGQSPEDSLHASILRAVPESNGSKRFCRPVTQPTIPLPKLKFCRTIE